MADEPNQTTQAETKKEYTEKERASMIMRAEIEHWRYLEKGVGVNREMVARKIGALRFVLGLLEKNLQ